MIEIIQLLSLPTDLKERMLFLIVYRFVHMGCLYFDDLISKAYFSVLDAILRFLTKVAGCAQASIISQFTQYLAISEPYWVALSSLALQTKSKRLSTPIQPRLFGIGLFLFRFIDWTGQWRRENMNTRICDSTSDSSYPTPCLVLSTLVEFDDSAALTCRLVFSKHLSDRLNLISNHALTSLLVHSVKLS